jgi:thiamine monophosphate synthase
VHVCALVPDMMDRSRLAAARPDVHFARRAEECADADVVIIDLGRRAADVATVRATAPTARIVGFGPHVDDALFATAEGDGVDVALPRSRFFRDITLAIGPAA